MTILLDIDGVLVIEPSWKKVEIAPDGFMQFNKKSVENLSEILLQTNADVVLTTTHRISFTIEKWFEIFESRGLRINSISKLNDARSIAEMQNRGAEIKAWVENGGAKKDYVIIDDNKSISGLPLHIKEKWVMINPLIGIDKEAKQKVLNILSIK